MAGDHHLDLLFDTRRAAGVRPGHTDDRRRAVQFQQHAGVLLYNFGFIRLNVGYGGTVGVFLFVVGVVFALVYRNTVQREAAA